MEIYLPCRGSPGDTHLWVHLQKYIITAPVYSLSCYVNINVPLSYRKPCVPTRSCKCNLYPCSFSTRWSGCVITAGSSRRSWPSQASGSQVRMGTLLASGQPSASRLCAKSFGLAPKRPPQSKTPTDPTPLGPNLASTPDPAANHRETRKLKQDWDGNLISSINTALFCPLHTVTKVVIPDIYLIRDKKRQNDLIWILASSVLCIGLAPEHNGPYKSHNATE